MKFIFEHDPLRNKFRVCGHDGTTLLVDPLKLPEWLTHDELDTILAKYGFSLGERIDGTHRWIDYSSTAPNYHPER
jgi:hypothetical protein